MDDKGKKPSVLDGILHKNKQAAKDAFGESPNDEPRDAFEDARPRSREYIMLDVKLATGVIESFQYTYLARMTYTPDDSIELVFGDVRKRTREGVKVLIEGRRLGRLQESLSQHRARYIQEGTEAEEGLKADDAAHIDRIEIDEKSEIDEKKED